MQGAEGACCGVGERGEVGIAACSGKPWGAWSKYAATHWAMPQFLGRFLGVILGWSHRQTTPIHAQSALQRGPA